MASDFLGVVRGRLGTFRSTKQQREESSLFALKQQNRHGFGGGVGAGYDGLAAVEAGNRRYERNKSIKNLGAPPTSLRNEAGAVSDASVFILKVCFCVFVALECVSLNYVQRA
jgi:hypothetical protein